VEVLHSPEVDAEEDVEKDVEEDVVIFVILVIFAADKMIVYHNYHRLVFFLILKIEIK
jgi:hypothetical protein